MPEKVQKHPKLTSGSFTVELVKELAFFDLTGDKANTKGTSNKSYHIELQKSKTTDDCQLYTVWGATGTPTPTQEWRWYPNLSKAQKDFDTIIKSKLKKGYKEIDVAVRSLGSIEAKSIVKEFKTASTTSSLPPKVSELVTRLFQITNDWVTTTLRCPLGHLSSEQLNKGYAILDSCNQILKTSKDTKELENLTNDFYTLIPHNLGTGARGQLQHLLLDSPQKIAQKSQDLDLLVDAKETGTSLVSSDVEKKYNTLNAKLDFVSPDSEIFNWINNMFLKTRASNHKSLGTIKITNIYSLERNKETNIFLKNAEKIAEERPKSFCPDLINDFVKKRPDLKGKEDLRTIYKRANVFPVWHGTRKANIVGITMKGFLIRPSGAILTGSMYGDAIYTALHSSKSINYCDVKNSYWAKGGSTNEGYLFLSDVAFGSPRMASGSYQYSSSNIKPHHSVWAKAGVGGVINDELMVYHPTGPNQQHQIRYLVQFETK